MVQPPPPVLKCKFPLPAVAPYALILKLSPDLSNTPALVFEVVKAPFQTIAPFTSSFSVKEVSFIPTFPAKVESLLEKVIGPSPIVLAPVNLVTVFAVPDPVISHHIICCPS